MVEATDAFGSARERTEALSGLQKELLGSYEQASRAWLDRVKSEVDLWTGLAAKLTGTRSVPEALAAYQECVAQRMQMATEDGQRLLEQCQATMNNMSRMLPNGGRTGST